MSRDLGAADSDRRRQTAWDRGVGDGASLLRAACRRRFTRPVQARTKRAEATKKGLALREALHSPATAWPCYTSACTSCCCCPPSIPPSIDKGISTPHSTYRTLPRRPYTQQTERVRTACCCSPSPRAQRTAPAQHRLRKLYPGCWRSEQTLHTLARARPFRLV